MANRNIRIVYKNGETKNLELPSKFIFSVAKTQLSKNSFSLISFTDKNEPLIDSSANNIYKILLANDIDKISFIYNEQVLYSVNRDNYTAEYTLSDRNSDVSGDLIESIRLAEINNE